MRSYLNLRGFLRSWSLKMASTSSSGQPASLISLEFEVFGKVQGVFFRKYTVAKGKELNLAGWCRNTSDGTVSGILEGPSQQIEKMKTWLQNEGSPKSRISHTEFRNEKTISKLSMTSFGVKK